MGKNNIEEERFMHSGSLKSKAEITFKNNVYICPYAFYGENTIITSLDFGKYDVTIAENAFETASFYEFKFTGTENALKGMPENSITTAIIHGSINTEIKQENINV